MKKKILIICIIVLVLVFFVIPGSYSLLRNIINPNGAIVAARWNVSLDQDNVENYLSVVADDTSVVSYVLNVESVSEVDMVYSIIIDDLESGISVSLDGGSFQPVVNNKVIFDNAGTILYSDSDKTKTHILRFKAATNASLVTDSEVNVNVVARQTLAS